MALVRLNVNQVSDLINDSVTAFIDQDATFEYNDANILDMGVKIENANAYANFLDNLLVAIDKTYFKDKVYQKMTPSIKMTHEAYRGITQIVRTDIIEASNNQSFELQDGASYDDNIYTANNIDVTIFKDTYTYEVRLSITKKQIRNAFTSVEQMNDFVNMLFNNVNNSLTIQDEVKERQTYASAIAETIHSAYGDNSLSSTTTLKAINLLYEYNQTVEQANQLTTTTCWKSTDFLTFAIERIKESFDDIAEPSKKYQIDGQITTWSQNARCVLNKKFNDMINFRLRANTYNQDILNFGNKVELINNWGYQGNFANKTTINVKTKDSTVVNLPYVLGVSFDTNTLASSDKETDIESKYVHSSQFWNYWFKKVMDSRFDTSENLIVYIVA